MYHDLGIFSCKRCEHYFSQTEMFTSNVQFGYPCPRGGGQAVQAGLSCPPPPPAQDLGETVSSVNYYCTIILEYLVVRDVNIISDSQTEMFTSNVQLSYPCPRGGGQSVQAGWFILPPPPPRPGFGWNSVISQFLLHNNLGILGCMRF